MTLGETIDKYVLWRQSHGTKFETGAKILRRVPEGGRRGRSL